MKAALSTGHERPKSGDFERRQFVLDQSLSQEVGVYWGHPKPSQSDLEQAKRRPLRYIYRWAGQFDAYEVTPPEAILGCWQVDGSGRIVGRFMPNAAYNPRKYPIYLADVENRKR